MTNKDLLFHIAATLTSKAVHGVSGRYECDKQVILDLLDKIKEGLENDTRL